MARIRQTAGEIADDVDRGIDAAVEALDKWKQTGKDAGKVVNKVGDLIDDWREQAYIEIGTVLGPLGYVTLLRIPLPPPHKEADA